MMKEAALKLAAAGWRVFALHGKTPWKNCNECSSRRAGCDCEHLFCHGFHAATTDLARVTAMWELRPNSNIGIRPSPGMFVLDVDPRNAGAVPEGLPPTLTARSGRGDGGRHLYFGGDRPRGVGPGVDVKDQFGYVVAPPSIHPDTGKPYTWEHLLPVAKWPTNIQPAPGHRAAYFLGKPTEWMGRLESVPGTWQKVLVDWTETARGDWLHPQATTTLSARVVDDLLYVFSTSTIFEATTGGAPRGYNRIEAYALLNDLDLDTFEGWATTIKELSK